MRISWQKGECKVSSNVQPPIYPGLDSPPASLNLTVPQAFDVLVIPCAAGIGLQGCSSPCNRINLVQSRGHCRDQLVTRRKKREQERGPTEKEIANSDQGALVFFFSIPLLRDSVGSALGLIWKKRASNGRHSENGLESLFQHSNSLYSQI